MNTLELDMVKNEHESIQLVIWNPPWSPATARDISWSVSGLDLEASVTPVGYVVGGQCIQDPFPIEHTSVHSVCAIKGA